MTPAMAKAVLSPIYKNNGSPSGPAMYRPISVTTIAYRVLAKCIAQRLNKAVKWLIGETQLGYCPGRNLDENVNPVRQVVDMTSTTTGKTQVACSSTPTRSTDCFDCNTASCSTRSRPSIYQVG